jgi:hypothetical protein
MDEVTNSQRAARAAPHIAAYTKCMCSSNGQVMDAYDLVTDIVHYLRLHCGLSLEEAAEETREAIAMASMEVEECED